MVVGADVEPGIGIAADDPQRRRLAPALVAALQLAGLHGGQQTLGQGQVAIVLVCAERGFDDPRAGEHVAGDRDAVADQMAGPVDRSEEHTSELQSLMRISYAVCWLKKKT